MAVEPSDEWLRAANERYRQADIPHKRRPMEAWREYSMEKGLSLAFGDPIVERIFAWFKANSPPGAMQIGPYFRGAAFYDAHFWPVDIPLFFGSVSIDAAKCLVMPDNIKTRLFADPHERNAYLLHWAACVDYIMSYEEMSKAAMSAFAADLLPSAHRELQGCIDLLLKPRPTAKAGQSAALAAEMYLKWALAHNDGLTEREARSRYGHRLGDLASAASKFCAPGLDAVTLAHLAKLPSVEERYSATAAPIRELSVHYEVTQDMAARVMRFVTGHNLSTKIRDGLKDA